MSAAALVEMIATQSGHVHDRVYAMKVLDSADL